MLFRSEKFLDDEQNTNVKTVLLMKIGSAGDRTTSPHGIHWHVSPDNKIDYRSTDHSRMVIPEITLTRKDGTKVVYRTDDAEAVLAEAGAKAESREFDCIDCHNRPSHIYLSADVALNNKLLEGAIPRELPYVKKMALEVVKPEYKTQEEGKAAIATELNAWYNKNYPDLVAQKPELLTQAIAGVQAAYAENVFPEMNLQWGTYTNHLGHNDDSGCFRCHDESHTAESGESISMDCNICHVILAEDEQDPAILKTIRE